MDRWEDEIFPVSHSTPRTPSGVGLPKSSLPNRAPPLDRFKWKGLLAVPPKLDKSRYERVLNRADAVAHPRFLSALRIDRELVGTGRPDNFIYGVANVAERASNQRVIFRTSHVYDVDLRCKFDEKPIAKLTKGVPVKGR